jgi:hypothetical protein
MTKSYPELKNVIFQKRISKILEKHKVFFAFSGLQLVAGLKKINEKKENVTSLGSGQILPKANVSAYLDEMLEASGWFNNEVKKLDANSVIRYELNNYECYYTGDITDALDVLKNYGLTSDQVSAVYHNKNAVISWN